jgi:hypothetical protein
VKKTFKENQSFDVNRQWLIEKGIEHGSGACLPGNAPPPRAGHLMMALAVLMVFQAGCTPAEKDLSVFQDITRDSGLAAYEGMTHGAAWGDYDGDGRPDLYLTNHLMPAALFRNLGGGRFEDVSQRVLGPDNLGATNTARPGRISTMTATWIWSSSPAPFRAWARSPNTCS